MIDPSRTKVLFVLASGRTGSTILGNVLGEMEGFFHAGELRRLWSHGLLHSRWCGCGLPIKECPFWVKVLDVGFGAVDAQQIYRWERAAIRQRYALRFLHSPQETHRSPSLTSYIEAAGRLYKAMAEVSGAAVVVDSSKRAQYAAVLKLIPEIEPYWLHLVRDPRAVSYSWQRRKSSPGAAGGRRTEMVRTGPFTSTRKWMLSSLFGEALRRRVEDRYLCVRYEDFVRHPETTLRTIGDFVGRPGVSLPVENGNAVHLSTNHTAGGNPDRLNTGTVQLRSDDEWIEKQLPLHRLTVTSMALPMLARYGYRIRVKCDAGKHGDALLAREHQATPRC
jgi:hypothetical protein